jgi:RNA polymerase sigma-70 factor (ECF subfamily)
VKGHEANDAANDAANDGAHDGTHDGGIAAAIGPGNDAAIDAAIDAAHEAGRAAWPQVSFPRADFERWARAADVDVDALVSRGDELYLVAACVAQQPGAIAAFEKRFLASLTTNVGRVALSSDQADELRQQLRVTLLTGENPRIGTFRGQGPLGAWVQVCAVRLALRLGSNRSRMLMPDTGLLEELVSRDADQELLAAKARYQDTFQSALEECFVGLDGRQKTLLRMHFLDGMSIDEMGLVFRVHRATIARWLVAIRREVLETLCRKVSMHLRTSSSEFNSLVRLVHSDVRLSLRRLLAEKPSR